MEPEEQVTNVGGFGGQCEFTVVNDCSIAISKVRITHFLKGDLTTEYFIQENMSKGEKVPTKFISRSGKNDNWTVSFQLGGGGFMCGKLDKSMQKDRSDYKLVIGEETFAFRYVENGETKEATTAVHSVYEILAKT
jgi:hypothetical protein